MRGVENTEVFKKAQKHFKSKFLDNKECHHITECDWKIFKDAFFEYSQYLCPICELQLSNHSSDIDHTRPKSKYEFLKCCCKNYMIMCADCNRSYKRAKFPLNTDFVATDIITIDKEENLLVNLREDDIYDYFELAFINGKDSGKKVLILQAKNGKEKALKTIELFGLNDCKPSSRTQKCRIELLNNHYLNFYGLAQKLDDILFDLEDKFEDNEQKIIDAFEIEFQKELNRCYNRELLEKYGFLEFLRRRQFIVAV